MTHFNPDYTIEWYYKRRHGKGPTDGVGEAVKNVFSTRKIKKMCD